MERLFNGESGHRFPSSVVGRAQRKLDILNAATSIEDLRSPPGNRLERLSGDREDQYSIRINRQWRICFRWTEDGVSDVEVNNHYA